MESNVFSISVPSELYNLAAGTTLDSPGRIPPAFQVLKNLEKHSQVMPWRIDELSLEAGYLDCFWMISVFLLHSQKMQ